MELSSREFVEAEKRGPDPVRILPGLEESRLRNLALRLAVRHRHPSLSSATASYLNAGSTGLRRNAVRNAWIQGDVRESTRRELALRLRDRDAEVRDLAAEYFRWWGAPEDVASLRGALRFERDAHVKAALWEAGKAIRMRAGRLEEGKSETSPADGLSNDIHRLREDTSKENRREVWSRFVKQSPYEPYFVYGAGFTPSPPGEDVKASAVSRITFLRTMAGYPALRPAPTKPRGETPTAVTWIPPVSGYFDRERESYGFHTGGDGGPFASSVHVGDDVAWRRPVISVVAISAGRVRHVREASPSWGGIVVVEHVRPGGERLCSLYSHLGPALTVREGDIVHAGRKLGSLGRSYTWEGGGYRAHLHFGIHKGPFNRGGWITGYLDPERFKRNEHGWMDPVAFLRMHAGTASSRWPRRFR